jgi:hypothetical protein
LGRNDRDQALKGGHVTHGRAAKFHHSWAGSVAHSQVKFNRLGVHCQVITMT